MLDRDEFKRAVFTAPFAGAKTCFTEDGTTEEYHIPSDINEDNYVEVALVSGSQASSRLSSLEDADCLVHLPVGLYSGTKEKPQIVFCHCYALESPWTF